MIVEEIRVPVWGPDDWPFTVPAIRALAESGMKLTNPVTFLVGENGSGKSTIIEAIAEVFRIDVRGGHGGRQWASALEPGALSSHLQVLPPIARRKGIKSFFLRSETAKGVLEFMRNKEISGFGDEEQEV